MSAEVFRAGKFVSQEPRDPEDPKGFCNTVSTVEGVTPPSRWRPEGQSGLHRTSVETYEQASTDHEPFTTAHRPNPAPQVSAPPEVGSIDLGAVTKAQHKQLTDKSRKGKRKA